MNRQLITLNRICQYGFYAFRRNAWLSTAATIVMTVTLLIITVSLMMRMVFADTIAVVEQRIDVSIYLKDNVSEGQRQELTQSIKDIDIVTGVEYVSKEEARSSFAQDNRQEAETLAALREVQDNPFPASLRISTNNPTELGRVTDVAAQPQFQELQSAPPSNAGERRQAVQQLANWSSTFELGTLAAAIVFIVISVLIIFNTIRMAIFNRKGEIRMMRLIGADPSFIRGPFIVEAALYGVAAAAIASGLVYLVIYTQGGWLTTLQDQEIQVLATINLFKQLPWLVIPAMVLVGVGIGVLSSFLAMRRYLRSKR